MDEEGELGGGLSHVVSGALQFPVLAPFRDLAAKFSPVEDG